MFDEIELKLVMPLRSAAKLARAPCLGGPGTTLQLAATYYDTPSHALREAGISLRVRRENGDLVQTIKSGNGSMAGLFRRGEWNTPLTHAEPVPDERTALRELVAASGEDLAPQFTVSVRRQVYDLPIDDGGVAEVAFDRGVVEAGGRSERFAEVELELRKGKPAALFALARRFDAVAPVRIGVMTKSRRGWHLLDAVETAARADVPPLAPDMPVADAFATIAAACLAHYRANEDILLEQQSDEAVHQARVALRRLRSAIRGFAAVLGDAQSQAIDARLRRLATVLGEVRDLDAMIAQVPAGRLHDTMLEERHVKWRMVRRTLGAKATRALMLDLAEWIECGSWRTLPETASLRAAPVKGFARSALDRLERKVRRHGRHLRRLSEEARHRLRKDAKKLRYNSEFFGTLFDGKRKRHKALAKAMAAVQDSLGALNDLRIAREWLLRHHVADLPEAQTWLASIHERRRVRDAAKAVRALEEIEPFWK